MKNYNNKKTAIIIALSLSAICLVGGLFYYTESMKQVPEISVSPTENTDIQVVVPEIDVPEEPSVKPQDIEPTVVDKEITDTVTESIEQDVLAEVEAPSEDKPKTKDEATPPTDNTPPAVDENGVEEEKVYEPQKPATNTPKDGDVNANGDIYIEGFGWVQSSGEENQTIVGDFDLTGELVGEME